MLTSLLILVPLVVAEAAECSPTNSLMSPSSIVQNRAIHALPTSNSPRNLPFLPGPAGLIHIGSPTTPTTVSIQGIGKGFAEVTAAATSKPGCDQKGLSGPLVTAPSKILQSMSEGIKRGEERVISHEPLLGIAMTPSTTTMTITLSCQLYHSSYRCSMPMNGLTSKVCLTAEEQILCHVPFSTRPPSVALGAVDTTKTAPLPTVAAPDATVASAPIATHCQSHTGTLTGKVSVTCATTGTDIAIVTTMPTMIPSGNVAIFSTIATMLDSSLLTPPGSLSTGAALHNDDATKPLSNQKVNTASSDGRAIFNQALVCIALGVMLLMCL